MSEYTKGPWKLVGDADTAIYDSRGEPVIGRGAFPRRGHPEAWANLRLAASAPDLLEACQTLAEWLRREDAGLPAGIERDTPEGERQWRIWWEENLRICALAQQQVIAAIAKATGAQP